MLILFYCIWINVGITFEYKSWKSQGKAYYTTPMLFCGNSFFKQSSYNVTNYYTQNKRETLHKKVAGLIYY